MNRKTYADECLERAEKATEGPWTTVPCWNGEFATINELIVVDDVSRAPTTLAYISDAYFIAAARTDVPELARRLKLAIERLSEDGHWTLITDLEAPMVKVNK